MDFKEELQKMYMDFFAGIDKKTILTAGATATAGYLLLIGLLVIF